MEPATVGLLGMVLLVVLLFLGVPVGIAMGIVGFLGVAYVRSLDSALQLLRLVPYDQSANYTLTVLPLFVLMGFLASHSGLSKRLYDTCYRWLGHLPGGLAIASTWACAGFAAMCGASPACAATMGAIALPEMKKYNYDPSLATGSIAAGGTLGILIPPSVGFILYGIITQNSIGDLFVAGIIPGIVLASLFSVVTLVVARRNPDKAPPGPRSTMRERLVAFQGVWPVALLFVFVIGGMLAGWFTPTEAAAVGALGVLLYMIFTGNFSSRILANCLLDTGRNTAMVFVILIGAFMFGYFLAATDLPGLLTRAVAGLPLPPVLIMVCILAFYLVLGCIMDAIAMILLTVPIFYPVVTSLGFDPIWFGVIIVIVMEQALITPPVGMNAYIISGVSREPLETVFRGIWPFWAAMLVCLAIMLAFPKLALFLPQALR